MYQVTQNPSIEELMATIDALKPTISPILMDAYSLGKGRPPIDPLSMFKAVICRTRVPSLRQDCGWLLSNPRVLGSTGLARVPTHQAFSVFINRLGERRLQRISESVVAELTKSWSDFGKIIAVDGTVVKAYARNNLGIRSTTDPDARPGYKEHSPTGKPRFEFGYRFTIATDCPYEVPITGITTPANVNEGRLYPTVLKRLRNLELPFEVMIADAQYDSRTNLMLTIAYKAKPVIAINPRASEKAKLTGTRKSDAILPIIKTTIKGEPIVVAICAKRITRTRT
jgi:hypothetical protein